MKLLVSAEAFGYGPIATCINIIKEIKKQDNIQLDFIGSGISLEQAKMSNLFKQYFECDTNDFEDLEKNKEIFTKYDAFFSSENVNGAIFAQKYIKKVYYVDNLVWMWDKIPEDLGKVNAFFISETMPCKENFKRVGNVIKNPIFVGPVRNMEESDNKTDKNQLLINVGGASSFLFEQKIINEFYNKIINYILTKNVIEKFDKIIICGGSKVINDLKINNTSDKITINTLSHREYLKVMSESSHCIMSSGLGNFIETLNANKNILYLPPVNYSQLLQLQYYNQMNFGFKIINWDLFDFYKEIPLYLEESEGVNRVVENINNFNAGNYQSIIHNYVLDYLNSNQDCYFKHRNEVYNRFDKNAVKTISDYIVNDIRK